MKYGVWLLGLALSAAALAQNSDEPVIFRSDVSQVRVDVQVVDRDNRPIRGLEARDFILREEGKPQPIRGFASEKVPLDVLLLLDVSGSMRPHVQRIASASRDALRQLTDQDRMAIMIFSDNTRLRLNFRNNREDVTRELENILRSERFKGGTRITNALLDAADYVQTHARSEARRAIIILTDDQTPDDRDEDRVGRALTRADTVLSFLRAPYALPQQTLGRRRGGHGGGWPGGGGGGVGLPGGGGWPGTPPVIFGPGPRRGGGGYGGGDDSHSAGTAAIAEASGGDTFSVDNASALEDTLARLRERYALYFTVPPGVRPGEQRSIQVSLSDAATLKYPYAELRFRRVYVAPSRAGDSYEAERVKSSAPLDNSPSSLQDSPSSDSAPKRRRVAVDEDSGPHVNIGAEPQN